MSLPVRLSARLSHAGFDPARLGFGVRTAIAACLALFLGWLLGLQHPQWSAMTVWAASQPVRGMLVEKSFFRAAGTLAGVLVGIGLVLVTGGTPLALVLGLAAWIGVCAFAGNVLRGFVAYGTILAGYSAAMVALLDTPHPERILHLGTDRFLTVLVGVLVATAVGLAFTPPHAEDGPWGEMRRLTARILDALAARARGGPAPAADTRHGWLSAMAAIEETLDPHGAGSLRSRKTAHALRAILVAEVEAVLWLQGTAPGQVRPDVAEALDAAARALEEAAPPEAVLVPLARASAGSAGTPLGEALTRLAEAMRARLDPDADRPAAGLAHPLILHRDFVGARQAMLRAGATLVAVGLPWAATGWASGPFVLLGTSVMISLFSTFENPAHMMRHVLIGQACGAAGALACRWGAWPFATTELQLIVMMMPFILLGSLPLAHRRTMLGAYDYNLVMLLLLQPALPLAGTFAGSVETALAVVAGALVALVAFRLVFPADARRRRAMLIGMMIGELAGLAAQPNALSRRATWRARLFHRTLRLVRWSDRIGERSAAMSEGSLAVLQAGHAVMVIRGLGDGMAPGAARAADTALRRVPGVARHPEKLARAFDTLAARLGPDHAAQAAALHRAAVALTDNSGFFRQGERAPDPRRSALTQGDLTQGDLTQGDGAP